MLKELIYAFRGLMRSPGFAALAVFTLSLGIAANGALFSLLDAIYFRPLPLEEPERLFRIRSTSPKAFGGLVSYLEYETVAGAALAFEDVVAVGSRGVVLHLGSDSRMLRVDYVSENFFPALGIPLHLGEGFRRDDVATPQVILNHHLWRERLGAPPDVIGSSIRLNDTLFTVVGVTPPGFVGLERIVRTDVWVRIAQAPLVVPRLSGELSSPYHRWFELHARLGRGASEDEARAQLDTIARRWEQDAPSEYPESGLELAPFQEWRRGSVREGLVLLGLPALVLLIACANVANLLLARAEASKRELAIRSALGAGWSRLVQLHLAESLVLGLSGYALGILEASWVIGLFPALVPPAAITYTIDARFDGRSLAFSALILLVSVGLVALPPVLRSARSDVVSGLKGETARWGAGGSRARAQQVIVWLQVAVAAVVLVGAALVVRSLGYSRSIHPGFDTGRRLGTAYVVPALRGYTPEETHRALEDCRARLRTLPSVRRASYAIRLPAQGNEAGWAQDFVVPGNEPPPGQDAFRIRYTMVGPGYFETIGTRILRGRGIEEGDRPESGSVAVISETMARQFFPDGPLGVTLFMGQKRTPLRIVGVAEDVKISGLYEEGESYVYVPFSQHPQGFGLLLVEMAGDPEAMGEAIRAEIARVDPSLPVLETGSLERHLRLVLFEESRDAAIAAAVGILALILTAVGIHGLVTVVTGFRRREIGIRMALGATPGDILRLVVARGFGIAVAGAAGGTVAGTFSARLLESRLHGIDAADPVALLFAAGLVVAIALSASVLPAVRAARSDAVLSMREP